MQNLWMLLTTHFMKWIALAIVLGVPLIWYIFDRWLNTFANRIPLSWEIFVIPAVILLLIATVTVSFYTVRTALQNPVNHLKYE